VNVELFTFGTAVEEVGRRELRKGRRRRGKKI